MEHGMQLRDPVLGDPSIYAKLEKERKQNMVQTGREQHAR
jgi:hypothetical protein